MVDVALGVVSGGEEDHRKAEQSSDICTTVIAYEITLAKAPKGADEVPRTFVAKRMGS